MDDVGVALAPCLEGDALEGTERLFRPPRFASFGLRVLVQRVLLSQGLLPTFDSWLDAHGGDLEVALVVWVYPELRLEGFHSLLKQHESSHLGIILKHACFGCVFANGGMVIRIVYPQNLPCWTRRGWLVRVLS